MLREGQRKNRNMNRAVISFILLLLTGLMGCGAGSAETEDSAGMAVSGAPAGTEQPEASRMPEVTEQGEKENHGREDAKGAIETEDGRLGYMPTEEYAKQLGRTWTTINNVWLSFSGSGVEFTVTAKSADVIFTGDTTAKEENGDNAARVAVYLDGERIADEMILQPETVIPLFDEPEEVTHTVRVVKLSECANSSVGIKAVMTDAGGRIAATEEKKYLIEFIGDSITCGYGVDDENQNNHFSTATEDVTKAYAYQTAELLDADYSMVAISGYGIISGYTTGDVPVYSQTMGQYYDRIGFSYGMLEGIINPSTVRWDFSKRQPDCIVINLGTNDSSYCGNDAAKKQEYEEGYVAFLQQVRELNPDAYILCTLGIMGQELYPQVENAVASYLALTGDTRISSFQFDLQLAEDGYAADWHPTEATHKKAANKMAEVLGTLLPGISGENTAADEEESARDDGMIDSDKPVIALTFDDGPNNSTTLQVLEKLENYGIVASFFLIGNNITAATEDTVLRVYEAGNEINSHSLTHSYMNKMTAEDIRTEMDTTAGKIFDIIGEYPKFFRPPYIAVNQTMFEAVELPFISGYGANDWEAAVTAEQRAEKVLAQAKDGAIILLHDMNGNSQTVAALDLIIPALQEQGYQFVTVSQLFESKGVTPAKNIVYSYAGQTTMY